MSTKSNGGSGVTAPDFTQGLGGMASGSNSGFSTTGSDVGSASGGPQPMAGLTGVSSGMGDFSGGTPGTLTTGTEQYQFAMPTGSAGSSGGSASLGGAGAALGMGSQLAQLAQGGQQQVHQGSAGRTVRPQTFTTGMVDGTTAQGTSAGNGLLQLLQKYQVGRQ